MELLKVMAIAGLIVLLIAWFTSCYTKSETALAMECWQIFGVEMPTPNMPPAVYRSNKIAAAKVLAQIGQQSVQVRLPPYLRSQTFCDFRQGSRPSSATTGSPIPRDIWRQEIPESHSSTKGIPAVR